MQAQKKDYLETKTNHLSGSIEMLIYAKFSNVKMFNKLTKCSIDAATAAATAAA
jgi:hypothetical protein